MVDSHLGTSGITRTPSGRETYLPDGHESTQEISQPRERTKQYAPIGGDSSSDLDEDIKAQDLEKRHSVRRQASERYINDEDRAELQRIATAISQHRPGHEDATESYRTLSKFASIPEDDPSLQPENPEFDLTKWLKTFIRRLKTEGHSLKETGVVYKDLNVSGSGSALQLQQTVGSFILAPLRLGEFFSFGKTNHKKILQNFNGVIKSGEMLIVLGRPGSGCSTLLKSLTGQLHGLSMEDKSVIHYNGIPQKQMIKEFKGEAVYNQEVS